MKAFVFPLERVLDLRRKQVQIEELLLEGLLAECRRIEFEEGQVQRAVESAARSLLEQDVLDPIELQALEHFRSWSTRRREELKRRLIDVERKACEQRLKLNEVRKEERLVEKLRERRLVEWTGDFHRELEEQASEAFLARWNQGQRATHDCGMNLE